MLRFTATIEPPERSTATYRRAVRAPDGTVFAWQGPGWFGDVVECEAHPDDQFARLSVYAHGHWAGVGTARPGHVEAVDAGVES